MLRSLQNFTTHTPQSHSGLILMLFLLQYGLQN